MLNKNRWILIGTVVLLIWTLLACIKIGPVEPKVTPIPPTSTPAPPTSTPAPPTPTPAPEARPEIVTISLCRGLTDDGRPFAETNTYSDQDPFVVSVQVANMRPDNVVSARWYQEDSQIGLTEKDSVSGNAYVGLSLEPQGQWSPGNYKVEIALDGDMVQEEDFSVISAASPVLPGQGGSGGTGQLTTYSNDSMGFSVEYPDSWQVQEDDAAVQFAHPQDQAAVLIMVNADPAADSQSEAENVYSALEKNLSNVQQNNAQEQDNGWYGIVFSYNKNGNDIVGVLFSKVIGSRGYNTVFIAMQSQWDAIVPIFDQMWASLQIDRDGGGGLSGSGEVLVTGVIKDADTGRGIPNAVFVVLKEGVTVEQFVDSGNDKSLIYDAAQSDEDGLFQMNIPVQQGATYAVFAVADGYEPVVDDMAVPADAPDPWKVTVGMQKE